MTKFSGVVRSFLLLLVALLAVGPGAPAADAQSGVPLVGRSSLTLGSLVFTISSCAMTSGFGRGSTCSGVMSPDTSYLGDGAGVILSSGTAGTPLLSVTCGTSCNTSPSPTYDISLDYAVSAASGVVSLASISQGISGLVSNSAYATDVSVSETVVDANGNVLVSSLQSDLSDSSPKTASFNPVLCSVGVACLTIQKDIALAVNGLPSGATLSVNSVTQGFTAAPEPASLAMLAFALCALGLLRRQGGLRKS